MERLSCPVLTGAITILFGAAVWLFFPDSPLHAKFLTPEERAQGILRIKGNHSGIEQKRFKKHQYSFSLSGIDNSSTLTISQVH